MTELSVKIYEELESTGKNIESLLSKTYIHEVSEFHEAFNHPIRNYPFIPRGERINLRKDLIHEEVNELLNALTERNLIGICDGIADSLYVIFGTVLELGLQDKIYDIFKEVHRSNMSKACSTLEEAKKTIDYYRNEKGIDAYYYFNDELYFIYNRDNNKSLKSINYSPPDIKSILNT